MRAPIPRAAFAAGLLLAACGGGTPASSGPSTPCADDGALWPYRMPIDASGCASRVPTRCVDFDQGGTTPLGSLATLSDSVCDGAPLVSLRVQVDGGCPTLLEARSASPFTPRDQEFLTCFAAALGKLRFECAQGTSCSTLDPVRP
jgi:hypothetical protein